MNLEAFIGKFTAQGGAGFFVRRVQLYLDMSNSFQFR
jgi:hypothetical protein